MKYKRLAAAVLAAALWLTGCGGAAAPAAPAGSRSCPKHRRHGGADSTKKTASPSSSRWKRPSSCTSGAAHRS